jgi:NAD(P)-dependent dehydrogenase (short-subunit alcohol dehydrogenase family)
MAGSIILTGANGSAGFHAAEYLLESYPQFTHIFTVRSNADTDVNTNKLRDLIARHPETKASIHKLDLASLAAIHTFAADISAAIAVGEYPPLKSIICNASHWNLVNGPKFTVDDYEETIQVNHIAHVALVLRLVERFAFDGGRIVLLSSVSHYRVKTHMSPYLPEIPIDLDQLLHPSPDKNKQGRGFQRYSSSKLLITTWMYPLDRYLQQVS